MMPRTMRRPSLPGASGFAVALGVVLLAGCAVGPGYRPMPAVSLATRIGAPVTADSIRTFYDSLAAAQAADTVTPAAVAVPLPSAAADSATEVAWVNILRDPALTGLIDTALRQNRDLSVARSSIEEFRSLVGVARAPLFPSVAVNAGVGRSQVAFGAFPPQLFTAWRVTGDLAWELDFWGRTRRGLQAAHADLGAREAEERERVLTLVSDVASGYLQLLELDQEHAIAERTLASRRATLELARQRFNQGVISELDVQQFEAQAAVPAVRLAQVEQLRAVQENALSVLIGEAPRGIPRGGSLAQAAAAIEVPDSLPASLLSRRPDVKAAEREYAAATARIGVADAARLPAISILGSWGTQSSETGDLFTRDARVWQVQAGVSVPIFTGGELENESKAARARAEQARARFEQTSLVALREASDALAGVRATRDQVTAQQTQVTALRRALQLAQVRYTTGISNYLEVLDAQRTLFDAELGLSQTQLRQLLAAIDLYRALGGTWPQPESG